MARAAEEIKAQRGAAASVAMELADEVSVRPRTLEHPFVWRKVVLNGY